MAWCEASNVEFLFCLARNERLKAAIKPEFVVASLDLVRSGKAARLILTAQSANVANHTGGAVYSPNT
jgi:hypothetical protein